MKIILVYPKYPDTFWSFKHALKFIFKKATSPPLGLLTVAAMLPKKWEKKLVDMNVTTLKDKDLKWADFVFISAMSIQKKSAKEVISRCKKLGVKTVAGGPLFTAGHEEFKDVDHLVLNEGEITLPKFLEDLENGGAKRIYTSDQWADIEKTPVPVWELVNMKKYATMNVQYSRGCPYNCEFCDITVLYGHKVRTKSKTQIIAELESLYSQGWRGSVFFVDDNFIGNKRKLKSEILPAIIDWMGKRKYPFSFNTEASIDLSDDEELMRLMARAGFNTVFVGIETPSEEGLAECAKFQNKNRDLVACVRKIQRFGLQVQGGFIVGFDSDPLSIFDRQIKFIQKSGIVTAMVGLLNAPRGTRLYHRLKKENRLLTDISGDNTDCSLNFVPKMDRDTLIKGYKKILSTIYSPPYYYERVRKFLREYKPSKPGKLQFHVSHLATLSKSNLFLGLIGKERIHYWKLFFWSLFRHPQVFPLAVTLAIYGFHFRKILEEYIPRI
ncbi:B12-binding domain-containing radical SAM protein [candidate division WOR-3 bacterium JGI_Cruoil_03_51_56]|uniref:B12-binding domain-containing radical SAM protein n=1 Tax=candidate division WOR-3 bacterium JGI_Cruoil_03_51_56 TaxID=1973747 RepID=A0A235BXT0_UNCW3|nr:MAG: B12-binding domain-containing radical SAM protein [candidate division WOR-3 bacterium JGI_Cruoil_03_51_56]